MKAARPALAFCIGMAALSGAAAGEPAPLNGLRAEVQALKEICAANRDSAACRSRFNAVGGRIVDALTVLGFGGDRAGSIDAIHAAAVAPMADIRAASAYALANLGPQPEDFELLRGLLTESIPGVRFAAYGALKRLADERAQALVARARAGRSKDFSPQPLPFDPGALGVKGFPADARFLFFEAVDYAWVFTSGTSIEETARHFEAEGGSARVRLEDWNGEWFRIGSLLEPFRTRDADAVAIRLAPADAAAEPTLVAIVYRDAAMETTGFALLWALGTERPQAPQGVPEPVMAALPPGASATGMEGTGEPAYPENVGTEEAAAFLNVLENDGSGIEDFIAAYPDRVYRTEADVILATARLDTDRAVYGDGGDKIRLSFRNMPSDLPVKISLGRATDGRTADAWNLGWVDDRDGEAEFALDARIEPGVYTVRAEHDGRAIAFREIQVFSIASIRLERSDVEPGAALAIAFSGFPGLPEDVIAITSADAPSGTRGRRSVSTASAKAGTASLAAPAEPGTYEVRVYFQGDNEPRVTAPLIVTGAATGPSEPASRPAPQTSPGTEATATGSGVTISIAGNPWTANLDIVVSIKGLPGNKKDWVSVVRAGAPDADFGVWEYTKGVTDGTIILPGQPPGDYEIRVYFDYPAGGLVPKVRLPVSIAAER